MPVVSVSALTILVMCSGAHGAYGVRRHYEGVVPWCLRCVSVLTMWVWYPVARSAYGVLTMWVWCPFACGPYVCPLVSSLIILGKVPWCSWCLWCPHYVPWCLWCLWCPLVSSLLIFSKVPWFLWCPLVSSLCGYGALVPVVPMVSVGVLTMSPGTCGVCY